MYYFGILVAILTHSRSQGGQRVNGAPQRRFSKQIWPPQIFEPPKFLGWLRHCFDISFRWRLRKGLTVGLFFITHTADQVHQWRLKSSCAPATIYR